MAIDSATGAQHQPASALALLGNEVSHDYAHMHLGLYESISLCQVVDEHRPAAIQILRHVLNLRHLLLDTLVLDLGVMGLALVGDHLGRVEFAE